MANRSYRFETAWRLRAPRERVFDVLHEVEAWPRWWPHVEAVELLERGEPSGLGSVRRYTWRTELPYELTFDLRTTELEPPRLIAGEAEGELVGTGRWTLTEDVGITAVRYLWEVDTTRRWMNLLAPLLRPAFAWNHHAVMRSGGRGLATWLGAELLEIEVGDALREA